MMKNDVVVRIGRFTVVLYLYINAWFNMLQALLYGVDEVIGTDGSQSFGFYLGIVHVLYSILFVLLGLMIEERNIKEHVPKVLVVALVLAMVPVLR